MQYLKSSEQNKIPHIFATQQIKHIYESTANQELCLLTNLLSNLVNKITEVACPENSNRHQDTPEVIITATVKATQGGAAATKITKERQKFEVTRQLKGS